MIEHTNKFEFRKFNFGSLVICLFFIFNITNSFSQLVEIKDFGNNPGNLKMYMYQPSSGIDTMKNVPMVVALHGCSQNAKEIHLQSDWKKLADENKFIVIYPQQKRENNLSNCFNWFNEKDQEGEQGELYSIKEMIDYTQKKYDIDSTKIFAYGVSAGAIMSVNLLANYPNLFAGGAIFAGTPYKIASSAIDGMKVTMKTINKTPEEWGELIPNKDSVKHVPKLIIGHGVNDLVVDISNSYELIDQWSNFNHIDAEVDESISSFEKNPLITRNVYRDTNNVDKIIFYIIDKTGHTLPIDPGDGEKQGGKKGMFATDKDFFSTYYVAKDFGLLENKNLFQKTNSK